MKITKNTFIKAARLIGEIYLISLVLTIFIEILSKKSLFKEVGWMFTHPLVFLVNVCIVSVVIAIGIAFRRRYASFCLLSLICIILGVVNCIVMACRVTPLTAGDIKTFSSVAGIVNKYLNAFEIIACIVAIALALIGIGYGFKKLPKQEGNFNRLKHVVLSLVFILINLLLISGSMKVGIMSTTFANLRNAYRDYGFSYCFANSLVNTGVSKPKDYSENKITEIVDKIDPNSTAPTEPIEPDNNFATTDTEPNVIFIQLESLFNVNRLNGVEFTTNPLPNLTNLYETCYSGLLTVPSFSAGTANTEFEVLTGMNMDDFGPGEVPFKTILSEDTTTESIAYNLKHYGYAAHGMHNNTAGFYSRKVVYRNLGIDTFTSIEYMTNVELNALDWAKDKVLERYIEKALDSTEGSDFVFAVSVQGHGAYPDEEVLEDESLLVSLDGLEGEVGEYNFAYYLEQISEMDTFVGELIKQLEERNEKTVLVLYGDHLPGFDFTEADINEGTIYQTEYAIWSNFDLGTPVKKDIESNELSAYVMGLLGYDEGLITKLHQKKDEYASEKEYYEALKYLEYDMLYGDMNCWGGSNPYPQAQFIYGYDPIVITGLRVIEDPSEENSYYLFVDGRNFTDYSRVVLNDEDNYQTILIDESTLFVPKIKLKPDDFIRVSQAKSLSSLTYTDPFIITTNSLAIYE